MYDFGTNCSRVGDAGPAPFQESCNQAMYGQDDPPQYNMKQITANAVIFKGALSARAGVEGGLAPVWHSLAGGGCAGAAWPRDTGSRGPLAMPART